MPTLKEIEEMGEEEFVKQVMETPTIDELINL